MVIDRGPRFLVGGDQHLTVEYGDDGSLALGLLVVEMAHRLEAAAMPGVLDVVALPCALMVQYDPERIGLGELTRTIAALPVPPPGPREVRSRLITVPVWYGDPWTRQCAERHGVPPNLERVAAVNDLTPEEVVAAHTAPVYWVRYIAFSFGGASLLAIDPARTLEAPKYDRPRSWTPPGTVACGGDTTTIYAARIPGGIQMLGRTPIRTFDFRGRHPMFATEPFLFRPGDCVRFRPIGREQFEQIEASAERYRYEVSAWTLRA